MQRLLITITALCGAAIAVVLTHLALIEIGRDVVTLRYRAHAAPGPHPDVDRLPPPPDVCVPTIDGDWRAAPGVDG